HKGALKSRKLDEDRRLFYVALTRTERALFVSGHHWGDTGAEPKGPSEFLEEMHELVSARSELGTIEVWEPAPEPGARNPMTESPRSATWPRDPLGSRRADVQRGAALVLSALDAGEPNPPGSSEDDPDDWAADVDALLAEREQRFERAAEVMLPAQLSVSQLVDLATDPEALAARLRRPLPFRPNPLARRGTAFHAWLERRFGATRLLDLDELPGADDEGGDESHFERLQEAFLRSPWAARNPVEVEVPFETSLGGTVIRGRIDAVFEDPDGGWTVIDWKTGAEPDADALASVGLQLAAYRLAWAQLMAARITRITGRPAEPPLNKVRAAFHYVRTGRTVAPGDLPGAAAMEQLVRGAGDDSARDDSAGDAGQPGEPAS
ncbi:MAG: PD-(D/E)XK nuclease family protein, partial [Rhodococcus sp. (in: high G+C Gram-positive bacteria)]|uniref:RecB family exonuclease n=2 Tax=unclassified Rhodococcus (in: high G+C Gram-positive bacteria) TaxID=192944 RepID=UPI003D9BABCF